MSEIDDNVVSWDDSVVPSQDTNKEKKQTSRSMKLNKRKIGVIGNNYLSDAMRSAFDSKLTEKKQVASSELSSLIEWKPNLVFVCQDIPFLKTDVLDDASFIDTIIKLAKTEAGICIKTSINIDIYNKIVAAVGEQYVETRIVYSPEVEEDALSILNSEFVMIGGSMSAVKSYNEILMSSTVLSMKEVLFDTISNIILTKLGLSGFKAVKQTFFNQFHQFIMDLGNTNPTTIRKMMLKHPMISDTTLTLPTFVRAQSDPETSFKQSISFGGEYSNTDVKLLVGMTDKLSVVDECVNLRNLKD